MSRSPLQVIDEQSQQLRAAEARLEELESQVSVQKQVLVQHMTGLPGMFHSPICSAMAQADLNCMSCSTLHDVR
jgi:hypothetical protein